MSLTDALRGVIGLVDLRAENWQETLAARQDLLTCAAIPGSPDQIWRPGAAASGSALVAAAGNLPVLLGSAGTWPEGVETVEDGLRYTDETIESCRKAAAAGAAGVLVPTPLAIRPLPGQAASALVYRYFRDVQAKSPAPVVIFQVRGAPDGYKLTPESILSLVRGGRIRGLIAEDSPQAELEEYVRAGRRADFTVICGAAQAPAALDWGAGGAAIQIDSPELREIAEAVRAHHR